MNANEDAQSLIILRCSAAPQWLIPSDICLGGLVQYDGAGNCIFAAAVQKWRLQDWFLCKTLSSVISYTMSLTQNWISTRSALPQCVVTAHTFCDQLWTILGHKLHQTYLCPDQTMYFIALVPGRQGCSPQLMRNARIARAKFCKWLLPVAQWVGAHKSELVCQQ